MKVGIVGAGAIAFGMAAFLEQAGHAASLWSPSGERTKALAAGEKLVAAGAIEGTFNPRIATSATDIVTGAEVILIALPAYGHKHVFDHIAPHVTAAQTVIVSSHASFGALYLARLLSARGVSVPIIAWGTTLVSGRQTGPAKVQVNTVPLVGVEELLVATGLHTETHRIECSHCPPPVFSEQYACIVRTHNPEVHICGCRLGPKGHPEPAKKPK